MIKIIINADDLGKDHFTDLAIEEAFKSGCITSSTIMANSETWEDVHRIVDSNNNSSFGVHLNLTEGKAITTNKVLLNEGIVDDNNNFTKKSRALRYLSKDLESAIYNEWDQQISKVVRTEGIDITHIDGHHHIHMNPVFLFILQDLSKKYCVKWIRRRHNTWKPQPFFERLKNAGMSILDVSPFVGKGLSLMSNNISWHLLGNKWESVLSKDVNFSNFFNGYEQALELVNLGYYPPEDSLIELMCHPGHPSFTKEFEKVSNHEIEDKIKDAHLCSYNSIVL